MVIIYSFVASNLYFSILWWNLSHKSFQYKVAVTTAVKLQKWQTKPTKVVRKLFDKFQYYTSGFNPPILFIFWNIA